ncbi:MAG TPA: TRAP transporter substrate-binding protein [Gammaproteobacteria bacterium]|jgi:tripartite ATP-independent transporter DctP family solute receptor
MFRRSFLKASMLAGGAVLAAGAAGGSQAQQAAPRRTTRRPIQILMGGYGPETTGFSLALKRIGDRLEARFGEEIDVKYVYNIMDLGYQGQDILWLVENGVLTLGYQSSSYMTDRVPELGLADLPFLFSDTATARAAMDGRFGELLTQAIEANMNYRILGYFENGFRHISNRVRPIHSPRDLEGLKIRVLPSQIQKRTFELLGAQAEIMDLSEAIARITAGTLDAQENPFANTVTYGVHKYHHFHSMTNHFYLSRPIFLHRQSFDAWPAELQAEMRAAAEDAVAFQRELHVEEEEEAAAAIREAGGEIIELTAAEVAEFVAAVEPLNVEARTRYSRELLALVGR